MNGFYEKLSEKDKAQIASNLRFFGLNPQKHFKGGLTVPEKKTYLIAAGTSDDGFHTVVKPESIRQAKTAMGVADEFVQISESDAAQISELVMVSPAKKKKDLTVKELCSLRTAAKLFIYSDSKRVAHMENSINAHLLDELPADVHIYTTLEVKGTIQFAGGGQAVVLIVHDLICYPDSRIEVIDNSPLTVYATNIISRESKGAEKSGETEYDVEIQLADGTKKGADGANGQDATPQGKAANGADGPSKHDAGSNGSDGKAGDPGGAPGAGGAGASSPDGVFYVNTLNCKVLVQAIGSDGGKGGNGGNGGKGGDGGNGGKGNHADDGNGGAGGDGGKGSNGAKGGTGGDGGKVTLYANDITSKVFIAKIDPGIGGSGGKGGQGGLGGAGGSGKTPGNPGNAGKAGNPGESGDNGKKGQVTVLKALPPVINTFSPNHGPAGGGTQINITGGNYAKDSEGKSIIEFMINGVKLDNVSIISAQSATGTMPANQTGQYPIIATNIQTKEVGVSADKFTYDA